MAFNLPAIQYPQNALLDFSPVTNALARYQQASENAYDFGVAKKAGEFAQKGDLNNAALEAFKGGLPDLGAKFQGLDQSKKSFDLDYQQKLTHQIAGVAQYIQSVPDPAKRKMMYDRFIQADPRFSQVISSKLPPELQGDHDVVLKYITASALGPKDELDQAHKRAQIANLNSQAPMNAAHARFFDAQAAHLQKKPEAQLKEVNGKLVAVTPDMKATEIYNAGPDLSKTPEHVAKSANFAARMIDSEEKLQAAMLDPKKFNPTTIGTATVNSLPEVAANYFRSPEGQKYMQSAREWIRAYLRRESGAAISADEFRQDFITFFPQPNDGPEVVEQKRQARMLAAQGIANEARDVFGHLAPRQAEILKKWQGQNAPQAPDTNTPTITNPKTGQRMKLQNGQWVPY